MQRILQDGLLFKLLERADHDLAAAARQAGCPLCGAVLHRGDYPRKPRGCPERWDRRLSFCCSACRKRMTPASVRYLGRKVYVGALVTLAAAMLNGLSSWRVSCLSRHLGVDRRTLKRWREWWREAFVRGPFWKGARGAFARPVSEATMPLGLVEAFEASQEVQGMVRLLGFISPITVGRWGGGLGM